MKVKTLAHRTETVLDMVRSGKLTVTAEIINVLLNSFDTLRSMINNPEEMESVNIDPQVQSLQEIVDCNLTGKEKGALDRQVKLTSIDDKISVNIPEIDLQTASKNFEYIYIIEYDLLHDLEKKGKSSLTILNSLSKMGVIVDTLFDIGAVGTLDNQMTNTINVRLIYRTVIEPDLIETAVEVGTEKIFLAFNPKKETSSNENVAQPDVKKHIETEEKKEIPEKEKETRTGAATVKQQVVESGETAQKISGVISETVRINVEALDTLMTQAGELVLSRNQLIDSIGKNDQRALRVSAQRLSFVISELQEAVMKTRLQPIGNVFNKFPRMVRDLSKILNKELHLDIEGKDVELDKTIIEGLSDPLTHMVRNAADHGIESLEKRIKSGKQAVGTITLKAFHEAGHVVVEVGDDGNGIDSSKIADKALSMGLVSEEKLKGMTDYDKASLIFLPGLSTAEKVTETSGRGVGMDVVKNNLDRLGGKVTIHTNIGKGTVFNIKLPLTLAIIPSLIIYEESERFAIPQVNVTELLRIPSSQIKERLQIVGDAEVVVLRGEFIPILRLSSVLGLTKTYINPKTGQVEIDRRSRVADRRSKRRSIEGKMDSGTLPEDIEKRRSGKDRRISASSDINIVITSSGLLQYGLVVDNMRNTEEIVVKPLGKHLKGLQEYAGATIMGDGEVALIIDVTGLALKAGVTSVSAVKKEKNLIDTIGGEGEHSLLLFNNSENETCAIPLELVLRVERIEAHQVEKKGAIRSMQYRDQLLPLVQLADVARVSEVPMDKELVVIVIRVAKREVGLLGLMPVSVVETEFAVDVMIHRQPGISGSTIIKNTTILMVDIFEIIDKMYPEWKVATIDAEKSSGKTILLAEDSDFFREQVKKYLQDGGYKVITAVDGLDAWEKLLQNIGEIKIVVTDIEMPRMNGLELCQNIRKHKETESLPVIALTSLAGDEDREKGIAAGISDYQVKLDRDRLLDGIMKLDTINTTCKEKM
ncbi:MAG TPA: chemotaxis protein CheW [Chitinispirillaceae bacterium]|nr:chemotaxis protein CheW [Chitinispirillaceae bacterium]